MVVKIPENSGRMLLFNNVFYVKNYTETNKRTLMEPIPPNKWQEMYPGILEMEIEEYQQLQSNRMSAMDKYLTTTQDFEDFKQFLEKKYKPPIEK